ncbi:MAG TPA: hypothetical protein VIM55_06635 [Mucilaginibacter sp.]
MPALHYKNGTDTVTIKAVYEGIVRTAPMASRVIDQIDKAYHIKRRYFSWINFYPVNCHGLVTCLISNNGWSKSTDLDVDGNFGKPFDIKLVVFKGYKGNYPKMPYFIAIQAKRADDTLTDTTVKIISLPDVVERKTGNSAFEEPGLITINAKDAYKYSGKKVIVKGWILYSKFIDNGRKVFLQVRNDSPYKELAIVIENPGEFDTPESVFSGKQIRVVGKIIEDDDKLILSVDHPNQIQWIYPNRIKRQ